jgi:hypothetical protein
MGLKFLKIQPIPLLSEMLELAVSPLFLSLGPLAFELLVQPLFVLQVVHRLVAREV